MNEWYKQMRSILCIPTGKSFIYSICFAILMLAIVPSFAQSTIQGQAQKNTICFAYALGQAPVNKIYLFHMLSDGRLIPISPIPTNTSEGLSVVAANPRGEFLYAVIGALGNTINTYRIKSDGRLALLSYRVLSGSRIEDLQFSPDGHYAYALQAEKDTVTEYAVGFDGQFRLVATLQTGPTPISLAFDPSGKFAYLLCLNRGEPLGYAAFVSEYQLQPNGSLKLLPSDPKASGIRIDAQGRTGNIICVPNRRLVCVSTYYGVITYHINQTGVLSTASDRHFLEQSASSLVASNPAGSYIVSVGEPKNRIVVAKLQPRGIFLPGQDLYFQQDGSLTGNQVEPEMYGTTITALRFSPDGHFLYFVDSVGSRILVFKSNFSNIRDQLPQSIVPTEHQCSDLVFVPCP